MNTAGSREARHVFGGTGVYIALFLVVTALAVAGYWTLIPHKSAASTHIAETPLPVETPAVIPETVSPPEKPAEPVTAAPAAQPDGREEREEPAAAAQNVVNITLPDTVDLTPAPPALVVSPLVGETVAAFSMEELVYSETMGDWRTHDGIDIAAEAGTQVCAAASGTVLDVRADDLMGTTVVISHDGGFDTIYSNLQAEPTVQTGDYVTAGQVIGSVGRTAIAETGTGPHLHFGVTQDGEFVDPSDYLAGR